MEGTQYTHDIQVKTSLWSLRREKWIDGPEIPENLFDGTGKICSTALNDSVVIFVYGDYSDNVRPILVYDFIKHGWSHMSKPPITKVNFCFSASIHDKNLRQ